MAVALDRLMERCAGRLLAVMGDRGPLLTIVLMTVLAIGGSTLGIFLLGVLTKPATGKDSSVIAAFQISPDAFNFAFLKFSYPFAFFLGYKKSRREGDSRLRG